MVVKYIKVTFVTIFAVVVGLISTSQIKADTIETVTGTFEVVSEKQFDGDENTPGIYDFIFENMIIGGPNQIINITKVLLNGQPLTNPKFTYNETFNAFGFTSTAITFSNLTINKSFVSSNYGMVNHVGDVWTIEMSVDVMDKDIITGLPNEVWTNRGSGYYTLGLDNDYEYIYSNVGYIELIPQYNGRFTKLRLYDGDISLNIDLELYGVAISKDSATDNYEVEIQSKDSANIKYFTTPVLYISVYDNDYDLGGGGYDENDLEEAYDNGYYDGIFTVYENGFNGIINPFTNQIYMNKNSYPYGIGYNIGKNEDTGDGYNVGYNDGIFTVYENGFNGIMNPFTNQFYKNKNSYPYGIGYNDGLLNSEGFTFTGLLTQIFVGIGSILAIELLPNITLGALVAVPIVFGIIYFILGKRSKD